MSHRWAICLALSPSGLSPTSSRIRSARETLWIRSVGLPDNIEPISLLLRWNAANRADTRLILPGSQPRGRAFVSVYEMSLIRGNDRTRISPGGTIARSPSCRRHNCRCSKGRSRMAEKYKDHMPDPSETPPIDVMPASNGEYVPPDPTPAQRKIMALQNEKIEEVRRKFGMSRRDFVRTAAAFSIGVWAVDKVTGGKFGNYAFASSFNAKWRTQDPGFSQFLMLWTSSSMGDYPGYSGDGVRGTGEGEIDPIENLGRYHYFKDIFLDSSETVNLLTALPHLPDEINITPAKWAAETRDMVNNMTQSERCFIHSFSQPNRGYQGPGKTPAYQQEDFDWMASVGGPLDIRGWKLYCGWGDPGLGEAGGEGPTHNGWWFDDENGMAIVEHIRRIQAKTNRPPVVCTHKGLAFNGTFDSAKFSPRDMGVIGAQFPDITFFTYHSGYDGEHMLPYAGDDKVNSSNRGVDCFIKSLRENGIDATRFVPKGLEHGNTPNMFAELGTTWWANMSD